MKFGMWPGLIFCFNLTYHTCLWHLWLNFFLINNISFFLCQSSSRSLYLSFSKMKVSSGKKIGNRIKYCSLMVFLWGLNFAVFLIIEVLRIRIFFWDFQWFLVLMRWIFWRIALVCSICSSGCESGWWTDRRTDRAFIKASILYVINVVWKLKRRDILILHIFGRLSTQLCSS